jgi:hypothetical protein
VSSRPPRPSAPSPNTSDWVMTSPRSRSSSTKGNIDKVGSSLSMFYDLRGTQWTLGTEEYRQGQD